MRCAILGQHPDLQQRLRRLIREHGWQLADAAGTTGIDLAFVLTESEPIEGEVRAARRALPSSIILAAGDASLQARQRALAAGATDFIPCESSSRYIAARVAALMRVRSAESVTHLAAGEIEIDLQHRRTNVRGREMSLSQKEFDLLTLLARVYGRTLSRSELIEGLWQAGSHVEDNTLDVQVSRLRRKLRNASDSRIVTVRGIGYRLCPDETMSRTNHTG